MKLTILHDSAGNITALIAYPPEAPPAYMETQLGERVTEIEIPELTLELGHQKIREYLSDLAANHKVELDDRATLTRK